MDIFLLIVVLIMIGLLILLNLYIVAHYAHPLESSFGGSVLTKILVVSPPHADSEPDAH